MTNPSDTGGGSRRRLSHVVSVLGQAVMAATFVMPAMAIAQTPSGEAPWTVTITPSPQTLAIGACADVWLALKDATGKAWPRTPDGRHISMADFDMKASGALEHSVVGNYSSPTAFSVCACQASTVGSEATITATYPAATLTEKTGKIAGVAFASVVRVPIVAGRGKLEPLGCSALTTTTLSAGVIPVATATMAAPLQTTQASSSPLSAAASSSKAGPAIGVGTVQTPEPHPIHPWHGQLKLDGGTTNIELLSGGTAVRRVVVSGSGGSADKHLGELSYEPIVIATSPSSSLVPWINAAWTTPATLKSGTIVAQPMAGGAVGQSFGTVASEGGRLEFANARLVSTRISSMQDMGHSPITLTLTIAPSAISKSGSASVAIATGGMKVISNYRLAVSGLESIGVEGIESFVVGSPDEAAGSSERKVGAHDEAPFAFPNLFVTLSPARSPAWVAWYQDFAISGNNGAPQEKTFTLEFLNANQNVVATLKGYGVGIVALRAGTVGQLQAELYVERMEFVPPVAGSAP